MTKVILHGGYAGKKNQRNDDFFKEILKDSPNQSKILLIYFAKQEEDYERTCTQDKKQFEDNCNGKELLFQISQEQDFIEQIKWADIIYIHGGKTIKLLDTLKKYPSFLNAVKGKVVAGESAGAYVLSSCFYSKSEEGVFRGLGLVPVKMICHYTGDNKDRLNECDESLEPLLLADYQHKVFKV